MDSVLTCVECMSSIFEIDGDRVNEYPKIEFNRRNELPPKEGTQQQVLLYRRRGTFYRKWILPFRLKGSVRELDYVAR